MQRLEVCVSKRVSEVAVQIVRRWARTPGAILVAVGTHAARVNILQKLRDADVKVIDAKRAKVPENARESRRGPQYVPRRSGPRLPKCLGHPNCRVL